MHRDNEICVWPCMTFTYFKLFTFASCPFHYLIYSNHYHSYLIFIVFFISPDCWTLPKKDFFLSLTGSEKLATPMILVYRKHWRHISTSLWRHISASLWRRLQSCGCHPSLNIMADKQQLIRELRNRVAHLEPLPDEPNFITAEDT